MKNKDRIAGFLLLAATGCASASLPEEHHDRFHFPEHRMYLEEPTGKAVGVPYKILGWVRTKTSYTTLEQQINDPSLCKNYYNKAARMLLKEADKIGADAVIKVRSVVFNMDGSTREYVTPECADDGAEGEILLRGIAIKFTPKPKKHKVPGGSEAEAVHATPAPNVQPTPMATPEMDFPPVSN
jgi:hypothetical protein